MRQAHLRQLSFPARHGRPQAETVPLADEQAPLAAQDRDAGPPALPALPRAAPAAPRLPQLRHLRRPRGRRAAARGRRSTSPTAVIAVDANGADQGPGAVAEGVARSGVPVLLFGPGAEIEGAAGPHAEIVDAPETIKAGEEAVAAVRSKRDASIVQAASAVGDGTRRRARLGRQHRADARRRDPGRQAHPGRVPPGAGRAACRSPAARCCCSTRARAWRCAPSTSSSSPTWARASWRRCVGIERPAVGPAVGGRGVRQGHARRADGARPDRGGRRARTSPATSRASTSRTAGVDVVVADGFTGNVALKVLESTAEGRSARRSARGSARGPVSSLGGLLIRGKLGQLRDEFDPEKVGGAILLGLRKPVVVAHGSFGPARHRARASRLAQRAVDEDMVGRTAAALEAAGALRSAPAASVAAEHELTRRDEVLDRIREHLATELEVDPGRIRRTLASRRTSRRTRSTWSSSWSSWRTATASASPTRRR